MISIEATNNNKTGAYNRHLIRLKYVNVIAYHFKIANVNIHTPNELGNGFIRNWND